jgi:2-hydroxy-3-keto-5-methylthiopentenyl-1-phosphate phosphatase
MSPQQAPRILAILDYDGTLTTRECNEIALQRFVGDAWRPFEVEVRAGRMSHATCFDAQVNLVQAPQQQFLDALVQAAAPVPGLAAFLAALSERGGRAAVISAGFRVAIETFWQRESLPPTQIIASELVGHGPAGGPPYRIAFNDALGDCPRCGPGACKGAVVRALRRPGDIVLAFGDGAGDYCTAQEADLTFARDYLAELCQSDGIVWRPLPDFTRVWHEVDEWLARR